MRQASRPFLVLAALLVSIGPAGSLAGQEQTSQATSPQPSAQPQERQQDGRQPPPPRFRTEANYVRVDVYPTKDGVPVQDLTAADFEVFEDGDRQTLQAFEHVVISPAGPQALRAEADSVRGAEQMAANPRSRVFVFFLDEAHVDVFGSHRIKEPLIRLMDRVLGPEDLVAVMTAEMSAADITFGRKTEVIADMLRDKWYWGLRDSIRDMDEREMEYERCFPARLGEPGGVSALAREMKARRRERMALDALHDLVRYLGGVREERKAIVTITEGWLLYRPNQAVADLRPRERVPGTPPVGVDEFGKLRISPPDPGMNSPDQSACERERLHLANIDDRQYYLDLLDAANRNNATFYPVDPRGLAAFDSAIGPEAPLSMVVDSVRLRSRIQNLRVLAENTDGIAVVNTNDLDAGLRRIADDLTSYYLLGYYSTNRKLDGSFRKISVKVKRPGVEVRARRGYRAATAEEVNASHAAAEAPVPARVRTSTAALATLGRLRQDAPFAIHVVPMRAAPDGPVTALWIAGEVLPGAREFRAGGRAAIEISGGAQVETSVEMKPEERAFLVKVPVRAAADAVTVRAQVSSTGSSTPLADTVRVDAQPSDLEPLLFRRGMTTGNRVQPAADFRFSRTDRLRLELPIAADATPGTARLLDRNGQPLQVPVQVGERTDADGQRWLTADAVLAPLAAGDFIVEQTFTASGAERRVMTGIRVTK